MISRTTPFYSLKRQRQRRQLIFGGLIFMALTVVTIIGVTQLDTIRQFFSQASGEKANLIVDTQAVLGTIDRPWRHLAQGGEDHNWRLQPLVPQVKTLNPEYIRLDHIYDFYDVVGGSPGNLTFNFSKLDGVLDDIAATGAKPYISLSYMPPVISSGDIVSPPQRWEDWQLTVQKTVEHISGTRKTPDVYYEVWNEPDLFGGWKYYGDRNYLTLYNYAVQGANNARGVLPFKIGGPATTALYKNWFEAMAKNAVENNVRLDFYSWHRYSNDLDQYRKDMTEIRTWLQAYPQLEVTTEQHITEWGHDSNNHPGYDTNFSAAHTVAGAIEMVGVVEQAYVFEIQDGKDPQGQAQWGRWGMFQHTDFGAQPKPRYQALKMLEGIAGQRLQLLGKGTWVKALATRDETGHIDVILANFDPRGVNAENVPLTFKNLEPGTYTVTQEFLGGQRRSYQETVTESILQTTVAMGPNSVAVVKLDKN